MQIFDLETEAHLVNSGFTVARDLGLSYDKALEVATRPEVLEPALAVSRDLTVMQSEIVALVLQQPEVGEIQISSR